eukprot:CAMPEP_0196131878 /NCGR_PEP_ID=MMETSP0910-20130528/1705_1 /TAXON_ID=49265 /ORGANISM="Thalassiosira rotula, Strain GSO102" /LENGTH=605 /DNA_ID=CAMNT_0041391393 /DNA_START=53 /DNA_END=1870 /DNA_ORIENTATION=-
MASLQTFRKVRKAAARISPKLSPSSRAKVYNDLDQITTNAPASAYSIPQSVRSDAFALNNADGSTTNPYAHGDEPIKHQNPGAVVRPIGTSRRVFLTNPSLTPTEIDGLAYRIRTMASNDAINSVVVANPLEDAMCNGDMSNNSTCLPAFMEEGEVDIASLGRRELEGGPFGKKPDVIRSVLHERFGDGLGMPHVSNGYDARQIHEAGIARDGARLERELMSPLAALSRACRGSYDVTIDSSASKVPLVTFPHGLVADAGYSLLGGSYVLATHSTAFRVLNPLRGLAFDPVGLSYLLPRVGWEFDQPSARHSSAIASLLTLAGYEANAEDMVSTGLATHYVGGPYKLNILERALMDLNSHENQSLHPKPKKLYGRENERKYDINEIFRNQAVANVIQHLSEYDAAGADEYACLLKEELDDETGLFLKDKDPSLTMPDERNQIYGRIESDLVNWAATFGEAFAEPTVEGILERLREIASTEAEFEGREGCEEDVEVARKARSFVGEMEKRSPLALSVANELLRRGSDDGETLESCMEREKASQMRLFAREDGDFARWAESGCDVGLVEMPWGDSSLMRKREDVFSGWAHSSVRDVSVDEIKEIVGV